MSQGDTVFDATPTDPASSDGGYDAGVFAFRNVVGDSPAIHEAIFLACKVAAHPSTTVLLQGETGTGKELFARGIHYAGSNPGAPFVAVNCSAIPENLLESELFGHEKGAFTDARTQKQGLLELAGCGTVFLDEIGELPPKLQPKLLRVLESKRVRRLGGLEEREISCRVIAATNRDLGSAVEAGTFREDLYYRLNVFRIRLPPLRERGDDIDRLARRFVATLCEEQGLAPKTLSSEALMLLRGYHWPGNVRELKNTIERALILAEGEEIGPEHILLQQRASVPAAVAMEHGAGSAVASIQVPASGLRLEEAERQLIQITLRLTGNNRTQAARMLGISRPTINRKIRKYNIPV